MIKLVEDVLGTTPFYVRHLAMDDLPIIEHLQKDVYASLEDRSVLQPLSTEEFVTILSQNKMMIGVFVDDQLIGFRALLEPPIDEEHLGYDCGIPESLFQRVLYQEISNVSPAYRGFGLQQKMAKWSMAHIDESLYDYVCSTVKPGNIPSLKDKFSQGFIVKALKIKYVDKLRYVFYKPLKGEQPVFQTNVYVKMHEIEEQQKMLKDGYVGTAMACIDNEWVVRYEK